MSRTVRARLRALTTALSTALSTSGTARRLGRGAAHTATVALMLSVPAAAYADTSDDNPGPVVLAVNDLPTVIANLQINCEMIAAQRIEALGLAIGCFEGAVIPRALAVFQDDVLIEVAQFGGQLGVIAV